MFILLKIKSEIEKKCSKNSKQTFKSRSIGFPEFYDQLMKHVDCRVIISGFAWIAKNTVLNLLAQQSKSRKCEFVLRLNKRLFGGRVHVQAPIASFHVFARILFSFNYDKGRDLNAVQ